METQEVQEVKQTQKQRNESESLMVAQLIAKNSFWIKLTAVVFMISAVLTCLSIVGAIIGIPMFYANLQLFSAANAAIDTAEGVSDKTLEAISKMMKYFKITGIIMLIYLIVIALTFLLGGASILAAF